MVWLSDPEVEDTSIKNEERPMDWLRRNTSLKAKKSRSFMNFPSDALNHILTPLLGFQG